MIILVQSYSDCRNSSQVVKDKGKSCPFSVLYSNVYCILTKLTLEKEEKLHLRSINAVSKIKYLTNGIDSKELEFNLSSDHFSTIKTAKQKFDSIDVAFFHPFGEKNDSGISSLILNKKDSVSISILGKGYLY